MSFQVALSFEDGVTRFIKCDADETVADASYRARINIPLDCRDGACGTCKAFSESGTYDGGDYIEEALTDDEAAQGYCLTCQMTPLSDLVLRIASTSEVAKTAAATYSSKITGIRRFSATTIGFTVEIDDRDDLVFLPGQYVNIKVPGTEVTRSYSFSSGPNSPELSFLVKMVDGGMMSEYLRTQAQVGATLEFTGPMGSFFLREQKRPALLLAGGTGLAPLLSILEEINAEGVDLPIHLILGVNTDDDLVELDKLQAFTETLPGFTYDYCVADPGSAAPNKGYVTALLHQTHLNDGDVDIYLCGPPPMVEAVRDHLKSGGFAPANFYFEKFNSAVTPTEPVAGPPKPTEAEKAAAERAAEETGLPVALGAPTPEPSLYEVGEEHPSLEDSDAQFDARMALELGAMQLTIGRLTRAQLGEYRILAEASAGAIEKDRFVDAAGFTETNAAFHYYLFRCTANPHLLEAYERLEVTQLMNRVLRDAHWVDEHVPEDHRKIVDAFERGDASAAHDSIVLHSEHAKTTMRRAIAEGASGKSTAP